MDVYKYLHPLRFHNNFSENPFTRTCCRLVYKIIHYVLNNVFVLFHSRCSGHVPACWTRTCCNLVYKILHYVLIAGLSCMHNDTELTSRCMNNSAKYTCITYTCTFCTDENC